MFVLKNIFESIFIVSMVTFLPINYFNLKRPLLTINKELFLKIMLQIYYRLHKFMIAIFLFKSSDLI